MRLPLLPMSASCGLLFSTLHWATDTWSWPAVGVTAMLSLFLLFEWCLDAIVREIRKARLRA